MGLQESMNNILSSAIDKAVCKVLGMKDRLVYEAIEDAEFECVDEQQEEKVMDIRSILDSSELKSIFPRLQFDLSLDRTNPSVTAGIHSLEMQMDIYFTIEFILSLSGSKSINIEARYLQEGDTNTKYLLRVLTEEEFEELGIVMKYDFSTRQLYARLSDSEFMMKLDDMLDCIAITHNVNGVYASSIQR